MLLVLITLPVVAVLAVGSILVAPAHRKIPPPPPYLNAETVAFDTASGERLAGWIFIPPKPRAAVVVLHGVRANRSDVLGRAEMFWRDGFAVLTPDLQAHGESTGNQITYGHRESQDAVAAVDYMKKRVPGVKIGGVGVSLGGAAFVLAGPRLAVDAVVLEAVFPTITEAVDNRIRSRVGLLANVLTPLLLAQLEPRLGVSADELRPVDAIRSMRCPVLIVSGTSDVHTTLAQTQALFAAANEPKELWLVPEAAHVDLLRRDPAGYREHVLAFLEHHLTTDRPRP